MRASSASQRRSLGWVREFWSTRGVWGTRSWGGRPLADFHRVATTPKEGPESGHHPLGVVEEG
jgi:hypothetical protein